MMMMTTTSSSSSTTHTQKIKSNKTELFKMIVNTMTNWCWCLCRCQYDDDDDDGHIKWQSNLMSTYWLMTLYSAHIWLETPSTPMLGGGAMHEDHHIKEIDRLRPPASVSNGIIKENHIPISVWNFMRIHLSMPT